MWPCIFVLEVTLYVGQVMWPILISVDEVAFYLGASYKSDSRTWDLLIRLFLYIYIPPHTLPPLNHLQWRYPFSPFQKRDQVTTLWYHDTSTLKVFLFSSFSLLASLASLATANTCTDCTAVVSTIAARLMSEESLAAQGVVVLYIIKIILTFPYYYRLFWLVDSAQARRMWRSARQICPNSGRWLLLFYGRDTGTPLSVRFLSRIKTNVDDSCCKLIFYPQGWVDVRRDLCLPWGRCNDLWRL